MEGGENPPLYSATVKLNDRTNATEKFFGKAFGRKTRYLFAGNGAKSGYLSTPQNEVRTSEGWGGIDWKCQTGYPWRYPVF